MNVTFIGFKKTGKGYVCAKCGGTWLEHVSRKMGTRYRSDTYRCIECDEILEVRQED